MRISTSRFGSLEIQESQIIDMPLGLIGFPEYQKYALLEHKKGSPFLWWQSVDEGSLAFVLMDPLLCKPDYEIQINPEDSKALQLTDASGGIQTLVIVNIHPGKPIHITANLLGPIVINVQKKIARQIVLYQNQYSTCYPIPTVIK